MEIEASEEAVGSSGNVRHMGQASADATMNDYLAETYELHSTNQLNYWSGKRHSGTTSPGSDTPLVLSDKAE